LIDFIFYSFAKHALTLPLFTQCNDLTDNYDKVSSTYVSFLYFKNLENNANAHLKAITNLKNWHYLAKTPSFTRFFIKKMTENLAFIKNFRNF